MTVNGGQLAHLSPHDVLVILLQYELVCASTLHTRTQHVQRLLKLSAIVIIVNGTQCAPGPP
jgi:hypothetical protein